MQRTILFLGVGLRGGGGGSLGRVPGTRVASHPGNKIKVGRSRDARVVVVPPLLEREDHRHADSQPGHEGESHGSLGGGGALAHGVDWVHDGGVALGGGRHEGGKEKDVEDGVAQKLRHRGRHLLQQIGRHGEQERILPVADPRLDVDLLDAGAAALAASRHAPSPRPPPRLRPSDLLLESKIFLSLLSFLLRCPLSLLSFLSPPRPTPKITSAGPNKA